MPQYICTSLYMYKATRTICSNPVNMPELGQYWADAASIGPVMSPVRHIKACLQGNDITAMGPIGYSGVGQSLCYHLGKNSTYCNTSQPICNDAKATLQFSSNLTKIQQARLLGKSISHSSMPGVAVVPI